VGIGVRKEDEVEYTKRAYKTTCHGIPLFSLFDEQKRRQRWRISRQTERKQSNKRAREDSALLTLRYM